MPNAPDIRSIVRPLIATGKRPAGDSTLILQSNLAEQLDISQTAISLWLKGDRGMPIETQIAIAEACGCTVRFTVQPPRGKS